MNKYEGGRSLTAIWKNNNLTCYEKLTLLAFSSQLDYTGDFQEWRYISRKVLCQLTSLKLRKLSDVLKSLETKGYILRESRRDNFGSLLPSNYRLTEKLFDEYQKNDCGEPYSSTTPSASHALPSCMTCTTLVHDMHYPSASHALHRVPSLVPSIAPQISLNEISDILPSDANTELICQSDSQESHTLDDQKIENSLLEEKPKKKKTSSPKKPKPKEKTDGAKIWDHYASAFTSKYGIAPLSNARGYALSSSLVKLAGIDASVQIIDSYFMSTDQYVIRARHPLGLLVSQIDRFRVDNVCGNVLNSRNNFGKQRYVPQKLSHDDAWSEDFIDLIKGDWDSIEQFRNRTKKKTP